VETVEHMIQSHGGLWHQALIVHQHGSPGPWRWSLAWPFRHSKLIKSSFNMIDTICNRTYIYNILLEDPAVDQQILKITKDDVIFSDFRW
jgi:hypothetical protein